MTQLSRKVIFSLNLQDYMNARELTRFDVCRGIDVPYSTLSEWLQGVKFPRPQSLDKLAKFLGVSVSDLVEDRVEATQNDGRRVVKDSGQKDSVFDNIFPYVRGRKIPIIGSICAGIPVFADENIEGYDYADVPEDQTYYFLRVKGDSMINARIYDGDLVLVRQQSCAENGQIVVCLVNGDEATLKRFYRQKDMVILKPENAAYQPLLIPFSDFDTGYARVLGVVAEVKFKP